MTALFAETYRGKRVLVTGHTGFKGSWLALWLAELGAEVTGLALAPDTTPSMFGLTGVQASCARHEVADVRDLARVSAIVKDAKPEFVFHLAAQSLVRRSYAAPVDTFATNVMGTAHVLEALRAGVGRVNVVVVTSDKAYENREIDHHFTEGDPMGGHDPYSASKGATELVTQSYRRSFFDPAKIDAHGVALASARAGNVIGGGDFSEDRLVPDIVNALVAQRPVGMRNPRSVRPWQHVIEPLAGYLLLGAKLAADPSRFAQGYNFGPTDASSRTVGDVVQLFLEAWGSGSAEDRSDPSAPHEAVLLRLAIDKARTELGFEPRWDIRDAVDATANWYRTWAGGASTSELRKLTLAQIAGYGAAGSAARGR